VLFLGSGPFGIPVLEALHRSAARFPLVGVVTRPDRPGRRGRRLLPTPVRERAGELGLDCRAPTTANDPGFLAELRSLEPDVFIVADYGEILRAQLLDIPRIGAFNLHASLLPGYRGAAPVAHALLAGETVTGVTLFRIELGLDSGPVVARAEVEIQPDETAGELEERLAALAARVAADNLERLAAGSFQETPQDHSQATLAPKLKKADGLIRWDTEPHALHNFVRAMNPWPAAYSFLERPDGEAERTAFLRVAPQPRNAANRAAGGAGGTAPGAIPGTVQDVSPEGFSVTCRGGNVRVLEIQRAGKAALDAAAYLRGRRLQEGDRFGAP
jgi:methionyl-tRNA formyltransferase